jgi:hypothetical protein
VVVIAGTLGSLAGVLDGFNGTLGSSAVRGGSVLVTLENMSLSVVNACRVWVFGGGISGRFF